MAVLDQRAHEPEQQGQQQRGDVLAVDVGVGHQHDLVIAQLGQVEVVVDAGAQRGDQRLHLVVLQHPVDAGLLDVDDLAADRQDRLEHRVAAGLGRAAGRVALDDVELALAPGRWSGSRTACPACPSCRARSCGPACGPAAPPCGPGPPGVALVTTILPSAGVALEPVGQPLVAHLLHERLGLGVAELGLGLALELRLAELDRDDRGQALADVVAGELVLLGVLEDLLVDRPLVDDVGQRRPEALLVGAALDAC